MLTTARRHHTQCGRYITMTRLEFVQVLETYITIDI